MKSLKVTLTTVKVVTCDLISKYGLYFPLNTSTTGWK